MSSPAVPARSGGSNIAIILLGAIVVLLLLFLVWQEWSFGRAESAELAEPRPAEEIAVNGGGNALSAHLDPGIARVGELTAITLRFENLESGALVENVNYLIQLRHVEDGFVVFEGTYLAPSGEWTLDFGFFDGAEHELTVTALSAAGDAFASVTLGHVIEVQGVSPPLFVKLKAIFWFVLAILGGIVVGFLAGARSASPRRSDGG
jgi:hypothetical protein